MLDRAFLASLAGVAAAPSKSPAQPLGLTIPQSVLLRADQVIQ